MISVVSNNAYADEVKTLFLSTDNTYLVDFDEKIDRYKISNDKAVIVELMTSIFTDKHELLLIPKLKENTDLTVWTAGGVYNLQLFIDKENPDQTESLAIDKPPSSSIYDDILDMEFDVPPKVINIQK